MQKHFTATAFVFDASMRVLLVFHKKIQTWLPPGGHMDPNETPEETAIREVKEETGLDIEIVRQENVWVECEEACSFARPYVCLIENIPAHKDITAHQHIDFIYLARPKFTWANLMLIWMKSTS
jgi:8-oxo-dGTP pyrophosphatase MutT (NUDIX family)